MARALFLGKELPGTVTRTVVDDNDLARIDRAVLLDRLETGAGEGEIVEDGDDD